MKLSTELSKKGLAFEEEAEESMGGTLKKEVRQHITGKQIVFAEQLTVKFHTPSNSGIKVQIEGIIICCLNSKSF